MEYLDYEIQKMGVYCPVAISDLLEVSKDLTTTFIKTPTFYFQRNRQV